jgi:coenzyme F420-reducing hydrogenase delta subunit
MPKRETNVQLLNRVCKFSRNGALAQVFLLQAVEKYADAVIAAGPDAVDTALVSGAAWHATAQEWKEELSKHFGKGG